MFCFFVLHFTFAIILTKEHQYINHKIKLQTGVKTVFSQACSVFMDEIHGPNVTSLVATEYYFSGAINYIGNNNKCVRDDDDDVYSQFNTKEVFNFSNKYKLNGNIQKSYINSTTFNSSLFTNRTNLFIANGDCENDVLLFEERILLEQCSILSNGIYDIVSKKDEFPVEAVSGTLFLTFYPQKLYPSQHPIVSDILTGFVAFNLIKKNQSVVLLCCCVVVLLCCCVAVLLCCFVILLILLILMFYFA